MPRVTWFWSVALAAVLAAGVTVYAAAPALPPDADAAGLPALVEADPVRDADLARRRTVISARMEYKEQLVGGLIERRYTLDEVAREFVKCMESDEMALQVMRMSYRGSGDEARAAQNVIDYVRAQRLPPADMAAALARLHADYHRLYPAD